MARKRYKLEEIVGMLRQAEVLHCLGMSMADATRQLGISDVGTVSPDRSEPDWTGPAQHEGPFRSRPRHPPGSGGPDPDLPVARLCLLRQRLPAGRSTRGAFERCSGAVEFPDAPAHDLRVHNLPLGQAAAEAAGFSGLTPPGVSRPRNTRPPGTWQDCGTTFFPDHEMHSVHGPVRWRRLRRVGRRVAPHRIGVARVDGVSALSEEAAAGRR